MGYTTEFSGCFELNKPLKKAHKVYLEKFSQTRRFKRDHDITRGLPDPVRKKANLPIGVDGGYYVGSTDDFGQDYESPGVVDSNEPPRGQPGLWCQWVPNEDGTGIEWDEGEKFYEYVEWIKYLIAHFLVHWGYVLNGEVKWQGETMDDRGVISIKDNKVSSRFLE